MPDSEEKLDRKEAVKRLNIALELQYRSALQYSIVAASLTGIEAQALDSKLTEFGDEELKDARLLIEKIVSFDGEPTTEVAELRFEPGTKKALRWLIKCEQAAVEALQEAIEPTGREGRSEALEHLMEHLILRKQHQVDYLSRAAS
ncbi:MAG TPA: ferritin-like domain-containing protein [Solirubrobacterales bacterium]|jgi:bacterioferritin (cytochrome b1)|nr:ferritin-like domain-containing protein [Solirubrobacterales bacterium]